MNGHIAVCGTYRELVIFTCVQFQFEFNASQFMAPILIDEQTIDIHTEPTRSLVNCVTFRVIIDCCSSLSIETTNRESICNRIGNWNDFSILTVTIEYSKRVGRGSVSGWLKGFLAFLLFSIVFLFIPSISKENQSESTEQQKKSGKNLLFLWTFLIHFSWF